MSNFLPNELINRLREDSHFDTNAFIDTHERGDRVTSIRLNPEKLGDRAFSNAEPVSWCDHAFYLDERPVFTLDPLYHAGCYYVQEASSMFLGHIIEKLGLKDSQSRALDLCAAPGGKSTLISSYLGLDSLLVSNEVIKSRANILVENLTRWGTHHVIVTNNDPGAFSRLPGYFDLMVVDAPCSGSGMFRKDPDAIDEWSLANVKLCSDRQKRILAESLATLATGGYLIYSTCSYSIEENEDILDWIMSTYEFESVQIPTDAAWGIEETRSAQKQAFGYRFYPHNVKGEGFFVSVLKKLDHQETFNRKRAKPEKSNVPKQVLQDWLSSTSDIHAFLHNENIHVFPSSYEADLKWIQQVLYIRNAGTNIGKWTGRELIPSQDLALSILIKPDLPAQQVSLAVAQDYLRKENLSRTDFEGENGWSLVQYNGVNLGWVKLLPNRVNNYYPKESRIMNL
ncbi:RNA methyltransferase [Sphingobacterium oryzagri]|uniref:RNA methyltransferase n=1 Tax=Sphingobacterium oryzagri TaxID=3025669 RepID=A0ABY7WKN8_9SPHI|nr:RNA methyltransferase [Sphingobacterium sp. KACC 22765]WDF68860.1 RNA methyltransferase [Sphingobacterium sp. KACC 22765]